MLTASSDLPITLLNLGDRYSPQPGENLAYSPTEIAYSPGLEKFKGGHTNISEHVSIDCYGHFSYIRI
jgi:hypothetical protein